MTRAIARHILCMFAAALLGCGGSQVGSGTTSNMPIDIVTTGVDGESFDCGPQECMIDGACWTHMQGAEESPCRICDITNDRTGWTPLSSTPCEDGSLCTQDDHCYDGICTGATLLCDDALPCTADQCDPDSGECEHPTVEGPCSDGDNCTLNDTCVDKECIPGPIDTCDDGEPCTVGACSQGSGCAFQAIEVGSCDDGDACTTKEFCKSGVCTAEEVVDCDDGNVCTADACDPSNGCVNTAFSKLCDDGDQCTIDTCEQEAGCTHALSDGPCDDSDACTETDTCVEGECLGSEVNIDDDDPCTDDACDPQEGTSHTFNTAPCEDGDACTAGDSCLDGACQTGPNPTDCDDNSICTEDSCDSDTGCVHLAALECDDGNVCTNDICDPVIGCVSDVIETNTCRPQITITSPSRAATLLGDPEKQFVTVEGKVESQAGPIETLILNGIPIDFADDGSFSVAIPVFVGGNTFVLEAADSLGTTRRVVQSFHWSPGYYKATDEDPDGAMADPGAAIFLAPTINGKLEEIFEAVLGDFDIAKFIPNPVTPEPVTASAGLGGVTYIIYLGDCPEDNCCVGDKCYDFFNTDEPSVDIESVEGGLSVKATIENISAGIWGTQTDCSWLGCVAPNPLVGTMTIEDITITAKLTLSVNDEHKLDVELTETDASFSGVSVDIDHWTAFVIEGVINDQVGSLLGDVEEEFSGQIDDILAPLVVDALNALAFEAEFPLPPLFPGGKGATLNLFTDFADVDAGEDGMLFVLRAGTDLIEAPDGEGTQWNTEAHLGALRRGGCALGPLPAIPTAKASPLELILSDDTMNLLLHAGWEGGFLEFDVPPDLLSDVDLSQFGIEDLKVTLSGMLPPVLSDCTLEELRLHIGDLRIDAQFTALGKPVDVVMYLSLTSGFAFNVSDAGLSFGLTELEQFDFEVTVIQDDLIAFEPIVEDLVAQNLMPEILGQLTTGACEPTDTTCAPGCEEGAACTADGTCACDTGNLLEGDACVPNNADCSLSCKGAGVCVTEADVEVCDCAIGFAGSSCQDCSQGYTTIGGLAAFPLPEIDLSGGGALQGAPPIEIIPFQSDHLDGYTIISGDLK